MTRLPIGEPTFVPLASNERRAFVEPSSLLCEKSKALTVQRRTDCIINIVLQSGSQALSLLCPSRKDFQACRPSHSGNFYCRVRFSNLHRGFFPIEVIFGIPRFFCGNLITPFGGREVRKGPTGSVLALTREFLDNSLSLEFRDTCMPFVTRIARGVDSFGEVPC